MNPGSERDPELSEGGSRILRHSPRTIPVVPSGGDADCIEAISAHIERHVGPVQWVLHELFSDLVHVDVHLVAPSASDPHYTLVTSGCSEAPMQVPTDHGFGHAYAELTLRLPASWSLDGDDDERWPVRWLRNLARLPHEYDTWLGVGHTVPNGDPPAPLAENCDFCGFLLLPSSTLPPDFAILQRDDQRAIEFLAVYPLYREEMELKLRCGSDALIERMAAHGVTDVVELGRANVGKLNPSEDVCSEGELP